LRQQIRTLEERKTGDSESEAEEEVENEVEEELARVKTELEEMELKNADLDSKNTDLDRKATHLEIEILIAKTASELASPPPCEDCVVHEENYKWSWTRTCSSSRTSR
jgi:hypothetical protein